MGGANSDCTNSFSISAGRPPPGRWPGEKTPEASDYFTPEETSALVAATPIYPVRMAMRIMLRTWLRVSECLEDLVL